MITYHILNGDALKEQFPNYIKGELLVARECLVDGDVKSQTLEELFQVRAKYLSETYGDITVEDYRNLTVNEFEKIKAISNGSEINLWFEDDLFCQVNFWFVCHVLQQLVKEADVFLIRPEVHTPYGFAALDQQGLAQAYADRVQIDALPDLAGLWEAYRADDLDRLVSVGQELQTDFPFIPAAIQAHLDRLPKEGSLGRPKESLKQIINELQTEEFGPVFKEFNKRESIYGFGDLQVKRLFDELVNIK
ncbi:DUF1835 domain-containing protein [Reichenbachiella sp.]|uniref:DUF1835 domain-containing protein n=1 Tax=Reichenbachiella sp. TaxID=2184521 RepID=UPI003B5C4D34